MSLLHNEYLKTQAPEGMEIEEHKIVVETYGEIREKISILDHVLSPIDDRRGIDSAKPQRLELLLKCVHLKGEHLNPLAVAEDVSTLLAVATGRTIIGPTGFVINISGAEKIFDVVGQVSREHPNTRVPVLDDDLQSSVFSLVNALLAIRSSDDVVKYNNLMKAMRLYRDSLLILERDIDSASMLLVACGEVLGAHFSDITPGASDIQNYEKIKRLYASYGISQNFVSELEAVLVKPSHLKLRAKFVDVISKYLDNNFFANPPKIFMREGKVNPETKEVGVTGWILQDADWCITQDMLADVLKAVYDCRSEFVHSGTEWPKVSNAVNSIDLLRSVIVDEHGKPVMNPDGSRKLSRPVPSYFWLERAINRVLQNIILQQYGKRD